MESSKENGNKKENLIAVLRGYNIREQVIEKYFKVSSNLNLDAQKVGGLIEKYKDTFGIKPEHYIEGALIESLEATTSFDRFYATQSLLLEKGVNRRRLIPWFSRMLENEKIKENEVSLTNNHLQSAIVSGIKTQDLLNQLEGHERKTPGLDLFEDFVISKLDLNPKVKETVTSILSEETTEIKRVVLSRSLHYASVNMGSKDMLELLLKNSNWLNGIEVFPSIYTLSKNGILNTTEVSDILNAERAEEGMAYTLRQKIPDVLGFNPQNSESLAALNNSAFVNDFFIFKLKYGEDDGPVYDIFIGLINAYFEMGIQGIKKVKLSTQPDKELAQKINRLDEFVAYSRHEIISYSDLKENIAAFFANGADKENAILKAGEIAGRDKEQMTEDIEAEINKTKSDQRRSDLRKIQSALNLNDASSLKTLKVSSKADKFRKRALGALETLRYQEVLSNMDKIMSGLLSTADMPETQQRLRIEAIQAEHLERIEDLKYPMLYLQNLLEKEAIPSQFIEDFEKVSQKLFRPNEEEIKARITFDLADGLTIGRYGDSGQGNCFKSTSPISYNRSLMNFLGEPYEFQMALSMGNKMIGFMPVHLIQVENKGASFFIETGMIYLDNNNLKVKALGAAENLMFKIYAELGIQTYDPYKRGMELNIDIPESKAPHYIDFLRHQGVASALKIKIFASRLEAINMLDLKR